MLTSLLVVPTATSQAAGNGSNSQHSDGQTQSEETPWSFGDVPGGSPFANGGHHGVEYPTRERARSFATDSVIGSGNVVYHANGSIMPDPKVYLIWYGSWASNACSDNSISSITTPGIINYMISNLGNSAWNSVDTSYFHVIGNTVAYVKPTMPIMGCMVNASVQGTTLNALTYTSTNATKSINDVVTYGLKNGLSTDPNGIYLVLTSADVVVNGFVNSATSKFCGYHDNMSAPNGTNVKSAFVGDPGTLVASCAGQIAASPNSNINADAMASVIAHELVETASDPLGNAWYDGAGYENADKCSWDFGTDSDKTTLASGAIKNTIIGGRDYLIQQNVEANTNICLLTASARPSAPTITSFTPTSSTVGSTVTITGTNFSTVAAIGFGGVLTPTFTVKSATSITVKIPTGAVSGPVTVTTISGTATSAAKITLPVLKPTITSFTPTFGSPVTITGTNLLGATAVTFNGVAGAITGTPTATSVTATPPATGTTGKITVTTPGGISTASTATYYFPATFSATAPFTPTSGLVGATVTITGTNLLGATGVKFNGVAAAAPTVATTGLSLTAKVPTGATSGPITVTTPAGSVVSSSNFTVTQPAPTVTSFTPTFGSPVTITGTNLLGATAVTFSGVAGTITGTPTATSVTATPPATGTTGKITVTTPGGTSAASTAVYYFPAGAITGPGKAVVGTTITITGTNLLGATAIKFVGSTTISVAPAAVATLTSVTVKVPVGATSGTITVTTPAGVSPSTALLIAPTITSFTPTSGTRNATTINTVTITGTNFTNASAVSLTGVSGVTIKSTTATSVVVTFVLPLALATSTTAKFTVTTPAGAVTSTGSFTIR